MVLNTLLDTTSYNLDPSVAAEIRQQFTAHALGDELTAEEIAAALRLMVNRNQCDQIDSRRNY